MVSRRWPCWVWGALVIALYPAFSAVLGANALMQVVSRHLRAGRSGINGPAAYPGEQLPDIPCATREHHRWILSIPPSVPPPYPLICG